MSGAYYCVREKKPCVGWVEKYFKDCLCNAKDDYSFGFGIMSLVCWGVAEIPQIVTNFRTKSSHGVSLTFLLTWVAGDVFNLVGCLLEPATLPTQFYTALLYTISTIVLVLQGLYYDHVYKWSKRRRLDTVDQQDIGDEKKPLRPKTADDSGIPIPREFYYTSARSLAGSGTPPFRTYLRVAKSGPPAMEIDSDSSSEDETTDTTLAPTYRHVSQARPIPRSVGYGTFFATSLNLPFQSKGLSEVYMGFTGRRLLLHIEAEGTGGMEHSVFGQWLGWSMAAIYMGGRLPQICLNIKRGSVEGLNPLMFVFALLANLAYVLSIVVRTTEWEKIKPNLAWLLDAAVCVALDLFILVQYIYYRYFRKNGAEQQSRSKA